MPPFDPKRAWTGNVTNLLGINGEFWPGGLTKATW